jgi:hypothetical protein
MLTSALQAPPLSSHQHSLNMSQPPASSSMSTPPTTTSSSNVIFEKALKAYQKRTKQDLTAYPLAGQLQACDSPAATLTILQDLVDESNISRSGDERLKRWLNPTVSVLYAFSATLGRLGEGVGLVNVNLSVGYIPLMPVRQVFSPRKIGFC